MSKDQAKKYSMDISHVTAVELPLRVKNTDKAILMLGGQDKIRAAVSSQYRRTLIQPSSHSVDERNLELRLRDDPFHHPVQASVNRREKILMKVCLPKAGLPADYAAGKASRKYTVRDLVQMAEDKGLTPLVEPVAIINKNYNFRSMADFQMLTKNNQFVQGFIKNVLRTSDFDDTRKYYESALTNKEEFRDPTNYENKDHKLVPPPNFSGVRFPFDYHYQKSPYTVTTRDEHGDVRMVMKADAKKLFTNTVDYHAGNVPAAPLPEIVTKYNWLQKTDLSLEYADKKLYDCIECLNLLFKIKPIWLRKLLIDVVPEALKLAVKEALPYVSYCFKNGPWRFCNVRLGIDPRSDSSFWVYQSEYFRLTGMRTRAVVGGERIMPKTIAQSHPESGIKLSAHLLFTGEVLPHTINYQIGDLLDPDIEAFLQNIVLRDVVDAQDGWLKRQDMETIRGIIRYKLKQLQAEEAIDPAKVTRIIETDYTEKGLKKEDSGDEIEAERELELDPELDPDQDNDDSDLEINEPEADADTTQDAGTIVVEENVFQRIKQVDERTAEKLASLVGLIKQDALRGD